MPSATNIYFWGNFNIRFMQSLIPLFTIGEMIALAFVYWFWAMGWIPTIPQDIWHYGGIYFIAFLPIIPLNFAMACSHDRFLFALCFIFNTILFLMMGWLFGLETWQLVQCWTGPSGAPCRNTEFIDILMWIPLSLVLLITTLVIAYAYLAICWRLRNGRSPRNVVYRRQTYPEEDAPT